MRFLLALVLAFVIHSNAFATQTTFCGHFEYKPKSGIILQYYATPIDYIEGRKTFHETFIDANQNFSLSFNIDHPVRINVMNGDSWLFYNIYISPGDSIYMEFAEDYREITGKGEKEMAFMFEHAQVFLENPVVNKEFNSSYNRLDPIPFAKYWKKRKEEQLNYFIEYFKDTVFQPDFKRVFEYEVNYDYAVWLLQYSWRRDKDKKFLFRNGQYVDYIKEVPINDANALVSTRYVHFLGVLPNCMYMAGYDRSKEKAPNTIYYQRNQIKIRDSIAQQFFKGKVYDVALYSILYDHVSALNYFKGGSNFDTAYKQIYKDVTEFSTHFNDPALGKRLDSFLQDYLKERLPAPNFTAYDSIGNKVQLSDYIGKVVYVDFWATNCVPCVKELPATKRLQERFKDDKDVVFLYVSFDNPQERAMKFIKDKAFTGTHLFSPQGFASDAAKKYNIGGIPRYILIDKKGRLVTADAPRPSAHPEDLISNVKREK